MLALYTCTYSIRIGNYCNRLYTIYIYEILTRRSTSGQPKPLFFTILLREAVRPIRRRGAIYVLDAGDRHITAVCCVRKTLQVWHGPYPTIVYAQRDYLVVSGGQLLWVKRRINVPSKWRRERRTKARTYQFDVFEAADLSGGCGRWREVHTLMGNALFVSEGWSQSVTPTPYNQSATTGIRQDCIYFISDDSMAYMDSPPKINHVDPFLDSGVYSMRDRTITPLPLAETLVQSTVAAPDGLWSSTWLFPET
jgi:hypothetical protein